MRTVSGLGPAIETDEILEGLGRIRSSPTFTHSRRLLELLDLVVSTTLRGDGATLDESAIGQALYQRDASYDPTLDNIVRTQAKRLRERLAEYYSEDGARDPILLTIHEDGLVPIFTRRTFLGQAGGLRYDNTAVLCTVAAAALVIAGGIFAWHGATHRKSGR